jgi:uridine kinase
MNRSIGSSIQAVESQEIPIESSREFPLEHGVAKLIAMTKEKMSQQETPLIVGVAGASASGKTSRVAKKLAEAFAPEDVVIISLDNYMRGGAFLEKCAKSGIPMNWDHPDYTNRELVIEHLSAMKRGESFAVPIFSFVEVAPVGEEVITPKKVYILEGLGALHNDFSPHLDIGTFVETGKHGRTIRRLMRDVVERGLSPQFNLSLLINTVEPMFSEFVEGTKDNAALIIHNDYNADIEAKRAQVSQFQVKYEGTLEEDTLRNAGANFIATVRQEDSFYTPQKGNFKSSELLRVRKQGNRCSLCYKGPKAIDPLFRVRAKFEFEITPELSDNINQLYNQGDLKITKDRDIWALPNGTLVFCDKNIDVDSAGHKINGGNFIELQFPISEEGSSAEISHLQYAAEHVLGLDTDNVEKRSYNEIFSAIQ